MSQWKSERPGFHPGIELRIRVPEGTIFQADSDHMHLQAEIGTSYVTSQPDDWHEVLKTVDGLIIESRPAWLSDYSPED